MSLKVKDESEMTSRLAFSVTHTMLHQSHH